MRTFYTRLVSFLGSKTFFVLILVIFTASAVWLAISTRFPMAFDEEYHMGLIKLHALQWNPIFTHQPAGVAQYGALTRDPSYLYHYLMSFPYRLLTALKLSDMHVIVILRFLNVALFATSLVYIRRLLLKTKASPAIVHTSLLFFILVPVVPFLAATVNYDNLQILLLAIGLIYVVRFQEQLLKKTFDITAFITFMSIGLLGSLVKFTFLPFLTAFAVYWLYAVLRFRYAHKHNLTKAIKKNWTGMSRSNHIILGLVFVFSAGLFLNTYAVNIAEYHNPIPQCGQVVGYERCAAYSPWYRNYQAAIHNKPVDPNPLLYTAQWLGGMFNRLVFVINGKAPVDTYQNFVAPVMGLAVILLSVGGIVLAFRYSRQLLKSDRVLVLLLFVALVYTASVWGRNYHDYLHLKQAVAINGRYLVPILPPVFLLIAEAYQKSLAARVRAKVLLFSVSLLLFSQGGGVTSFIYYSHDSWYWDNDKRVQSLNRGAKKIVDPLFITHYFKSLDHLYQ